MHLPTAELTFLTARWGGDIVLVAGGVLLGNLVWSILGSMGRSLFETPRNQEIEAIVSRAVEKALDARSEDDEEFDDSHAAGA